MPSQTTLEANKEIIRHHFAAVWNGDDEPVAFATLAPDFQGHDPNGRDTIHGPEGYVRSTAAFRRAFPDTLFVIEQLLADGDRVAVQLTMRATHGAEFHGMAPTGRPIAITGTIFYRLADGKIAESWGLWDVFGLLRQLGKTVT